MESEGLLLRLQEPATGPRQEPDESNPHDPTLFLWNSLSSEWSLPFRFSDYNFVRISHFTQSSTCLAHRPI